MQKINIDAYALLEKVRKVSPVIHHLTNWVTIYDCANIVKVVGASPVMAHAKEEVAEMTDLALALVLNIGTLDLDFVEAMKIAARHANKKMIPVVLDVCGAGATTLRDKKSFELLEEVKINIIKGNASEIARMADENVVTKGVDSGVVEKNIVHVAKDLALQRKCTVVVTGEEDVVTNGDVTYIIKNGHPIMSNVVGTGCMSASIIGTFAAVESNYVYASTAALVCFEIAAERAIEIAKGPGTFKENLYDCLFHLDEKTINTMQKVFV